MKKRKKTFIAGLAASLALGASAAGAAEAPEFSLDPLVVTAARVARSPKDVPAAAQIITREEMDSLGAQNLADVLSLASGVQITGGTGKKSIAIRGFDSRFSMIMVDGRRLAAEPDQLFELNRLSLVNIERIEIIRGPQSALYGTETMGGVVNIITRNSREQAVDFSFDLGRYSHDGADAGNFAFSYQSGQTGRFRYSFYGSYRDDEPLYRPAVMATSGPYANIAPLPGYTYAPYGRRKNFGGRVEYDLSATEVLRLDLSYEEERTNELTITPNAAGPYNFIRRVYDHNRRNEQSLSYTRTTDDTELFFRYYQGVLDKAVDQRNHYTGALIGNTSWVRAERTMRALEGRLTRKFSTKHTFTLGAEYRPEKFRGTAVRTGEGLFSVNAHGHSQDGSTAWLNYLGVYVQDEWTVSPKLTAVAAARFDDNNKFGSDLSPKLGLIYRLDDTSRVKFNAAHAFRSPTPNQLYQEAGNIHGNPLLKSERANSFDISYEEEFGRSGYKLTYFHNKVKNLIETDGSGTYQNINKATIKGVEAELTTRLGSRWSWLNSYAYLSAENDATHTRLANRARNVFTSRLVYGGGRLSASLWAQLYGDYLPSTDASVLNHRARSYTTWNLAGSYKLTDNTSLSAGFYNIFDKRDADALEAGRYFFLNLKFHF